jgi:type IV pilus assembly protein PilO
MAMDLKSPGTQKLLLSVLIGGGMVGLFLGTHLLPFGYPNQSERLGQLKAEYEKKSTELARARATVADLPRFEAEYGQLHERWSMAAELLPADKQLPVLLRKVTLAAQETGCWFVTFRPSPARAQQYYSEIPLAISVSGNYHDVGSFLAELANMRRIIGVTHLEMKTAPNLSAGKGTTSVAFVASAYCLTNNNVPDLTLSPEAPKKEGASNVRKSS